MLRIPNFGAKSLTELVRLVESANDLAAKSDFVRGAADEMKRVRLSVCDLFNEMTVLDSFSKLHIPRRLVHVLQQTGVGSEQLSTAMRKFDEMGRRLRRHQGVGKKTIEAWRDAVGQAIRTLLLGRGFGTEDARAAVALVLQGGINDLSRLQSLVNVISRIRESKVHQWSSASDKPADLTSEPSKYEDTTTTVEVCIMEALVSLDERTRRVIQQRYGLWGQTATLEQIGQALRLTRERVRQIEAEGLGELRRITSPRLPESIRLSSHEQWLALVSSSDYLLARDLKVSMDMLSPWFLLALDLHGMTILEWLDEFAQKTDGGWISSEWEIDKFDAVRRRYRARFADARFPCMLSELADGHTDNMVMAALAFEGFSTYETYVIGTEKRLTIRLRRAVHLHALLGRIGRCMPILELVSLLVASSPKDRCSTRDCEIVMRQYSHLFLEVMEGVWAALGCVGDMPKEDSSTSIDGKLDQHSRRYLNTVRLPRSGIAATIAAELALAGPTSLGELMSRAHEYLPAGRSVSSVGVSMSQRKDVFCRVLPGVYALHHQVPSGAELLAAPPEYLLQEDQARIYALARRAGEPWGAYPLWVPETEYLMCAWAQQLGKRELRDSLLAVAQFEKWPDQIGGEAWQARAIRAGCFSLQFPMRTEALGVPSLDRVFAACLHVRDRGYISWVSGNRVLKRRVSEYWSAGLIAILVAIGALEDAAPDWQEPHLPGPILDEWITHMESTRRKEGKLDWDSHIGRTLIDRAVRAPVRGGWVTNGIVQKTLQNLLDGSLDGASSPLDKLLSERTKAEALVRRKRIMESLTDTPNGDL